MRIRRRLTLLIMLVIALCPAVSTANDSVFNLSLLEGSKITSAITAIDGDGNLSGPQIDRPLQLRDVIALERVKVEPAAVKSSRIQVRLIGGGRVLCQSVMVDDDGLTDLSDKPLLEKLPLETVAAIVFRESETAASAMADRSGDKDTVCLLYTSPSPRDATLSRMPSSA